MTTPTAIFTPIGTRRFFFGCFASVRTACAGFSGFARGALSRSAVERFSQLMGEKLGQDCWKSWGSEQFASNYLVANTDNPLALPFEKYPYWAPKMNLDQAQLIHFIGDNRFTSSKYARVAAEAIQGL